MKRIPIALAALLLISFSAQAADVDKVLSGLQSYWETIDTFTARFVQVKRLALLSGEVTSHGTFAFKKPGVMVWRYDPPEDTIMSIEPGLITLYFPTLKKVKRIHLSSGADVPKGLSFGMGPTGDIKALKDNFIVTLADTGGTTVMTLVPKADDEAIKKIVISFKKDYTPLSTMITEKNGDSTTIGFSDQKVNVPINDALFKVKIPAGIVIEDIGK